MEFKELVKEIIKCDNDSKALQEGEWKIMKPKDIENKNLYYVVEEVKDYENNRINEYLWFTVEDNKVKDIPFNNISVNALNMLNMLRLILFIGVEIEDFKEAKKEFKNFKSLEEIYNG